MLKRLFYLFSITFLMNACGDGDLIVSGFDFSEVQLNYCGSSPNFVFFKINNQNQESLSLKISTSEPIFDTEGSVSLNLLNNNLLNYRTFDNDISTDYFCSNIPPTSPRVTNDFVSTAGTAIITTTLVEEDDDGLSIADEFDGDSDGDGLINAIDFDDDGDNVPTARELDTENADGDNNPLTNPKDTDADGIPDYLDTDDDGDGIPTINEDRNGDLDPLNDFNDLDDTTLVDYLNPNISVMTPINTFRQHTYSKIYNMCIVINNLVLTNNTEEIVKQTLNLGQKERVRTSNITVTPSF